jgi:hypothetical protein
MKWFTTSYWRSLLMGDPAEQKTPVKRGRPKGSKNKPKTRKQKAK